MWKTVISLSIYSMLLLQNGFSQQLKNITKNIFGSGNHVEMLPVAFGDFNSDKLTDIFVLNQDRNKLSILLAREQTFTLALTSRTYFQFPSEVDKKKLKLECTLNNVKIESVIPGDFDGDGGMDIFVTIKDDDDDETLADKLIGYVLWGNHDQDSGKHHLICPAKSMELHWHHTIDMSAQPLLIDANGDYTADIFGSPFNEINKTRSIWTYSGSRNETPAIQHLGTLSQAKMRKIHSNSFVDLDSDGNADIIVTSEHHFELWRNTGKNHESSNVHDATNFVHTKNVKLPKECGKPDTKCLVGQLAFADFDLDGQLDLIFPVCHDGTECANSTIYFSTAKELWKADDTFNFTAMTVDLRAYRFYFHDSEKGSNVEKEAIYDALAPRVGDINLDGYPDILLRMQSPGSLKVETHLLLNVPVNKEDEIIVSNLERGFTLQNEVMQDLGPTIMATFFDLYENGMFDVILVEKVDGKYRIGAFTNITQDSDAYFVKVIVLSGKCFNDCPLNSFVQSAPAGIKVPYGTNSPGQTICYRTQRPGLEQGFGEIHSCEPQLTQTAHCPMQLPYTIFGLGLAPNFLDYMTVNVTNASDSSRGHTWSQIIPNSQMYVIPNPPTDPGHWEAKLFITPSRGITLTGLALVGTCGLIMLIIVFLHWRERKADLRERLQEAHRFHFDAM